MGVYVEHSSCMFTPGNKYAFYDAAQLKELIEAAGIEKTILGSDLGVFDGFRLVEGTRAVIEVLLDLGYPEADIRTLTATNAANLIGLEPTH
jgi:microsomal dipeptidase-like Zn-dependent dipeptidase